MLNRSLALVVATLLTACGGSKSSNKHPSGAGGGPDDTSAGGSGGSGGSGGAVSGAAGNGGSGAEPCAPPERLDNDMGNARSGLVGVDRSGRGLAVWLENDGEYDVIWTRAYADESWAEPARLPSDGSGAVRRMRLAGAASGGAFLVWDWWDGQFDTAWATDYAPSPGMWSAPRTLHDDTGAQSNGSDVAVDAEGDAVAVWQVPESEPASIWTSSFDASSDSWSVAEQLPTDPTMNAVAPRLAAGASGRAVATWVQFDPDDPMFSVWVSLREGGTWSEPEQLVDGVDTAPALVMDDASNITAAWQESDGTFLQPWAAHYRDTSGTWEQPVLLEGTVPGFAQSLALTGNPDGDVAATWTRLSPDTTETTAWMSVYDVGSGAWEPAAQLDATNPVVQAAATIDASRVCVTWLSDGGSGEGELWHKCRDIGGTTWGATTRVDADGGVRSFSTARASDGSDWILSAEDDGTQTRIVMTRCE